MNRYLSSLLLCLAATTAHAAEPLTVCMSEDNAPLSYRTKGQVAGFDVLLARAIASDLGRELRVVPFESEVEKETMLTHEVNALLSAGICDLVSGFPLLASDLGAPGPNDSVTDPSCRWARWWPAALTRARHCPSCNAPGKPLCAPSPTCAGARWARSPARSKAR